MNAKQIKKFSVFGLFGTDDVIIPFDNDVKIIIGENGLGKTQILNLFYYTLNRDYFRLGEFAFELLVLEFENNSIQISKADVDRYITVLYDNPAIKDIIEEIGYNQFEYLRNRFIQVKGNRRKWEVEIDFSYNNLNYSSNQLYRIFETYYNSNSNNLLFNQHLAHCSDATEMALAGSDILYFPTYRRVEEDLHILGYSDGERLSHENTLIQFGMSDVRQRFLDIQSTIDQYLKEGFSKISSEILSQLVKGFSETDSTFLIGIDQNDIEIILARVGTQLSDSDKDEIRSIVINQDYKRNKSLTYFLQKLVEIYEKQKELDNSVKIFRDICNKYLVNKQVFYDESAIKIFIKSDRTGSEIDLSRLSSGEKQIISIFSKIYLSNIDQRFVVLFDEPELSLSMTWQEQLLPDILNSNKCDFLLAVTHSPFIFDNSLQGTAVGLNEYIRPLYN